MHPRKAIRQAFQTRLLGAVTVGPTTTYATSSEDRVFSTMTPPIEIESTLANEGPVTMVYVRHQERREEDYPKSREDGAVKNRLEVSIEVLAVGANVDDTLDDQAELIEALLEDWEIPGFPSADALLIDAQIDVSNAQDRIVGGLFMTYHVNFWTPYRTDTSAAFLPTDVSVRTLGTDQGQIVDDDADEWPAVP